MQKGKPENPIDELLRNSVVSIVGLVQATLMLAVAIYVLEEFGIVEFIDPLLTAFELFLLVSDIAFFLLLVGAIVFIVKIAESRQRSRISI